MLYVRVAVTVRLRRRYRGDSWLGDAGGSGGPVAHRVSAHIHQCRVTLSRGFGHVETRVRRACAFLFVLGRVTDLAMPLVTRGTRSKISEDRAGTASTHDMDAWDRFELIPVAPADTTRATRKR
jgi:hypothetical protein